MSEERVLQAPKRGKEGEPCVNCGKHPGTVKWLGENAGAIDLIHGFYQWWCRRCALEAQLAYARKQAARIPDLEAKLKAAAASEAEYAKDVAITGLLHSDGTWLSEADINAD